MAFLNHRDVPGIKSTPRSARRLGYFYVSDIMVEQHWEQLLLVMPHIVPVEVKFRVDIQAYEYLAFSPLFEKSEVGTVAPCYECILTKVLGAEGEPPTYTFEFKRSAFPRSLP